MIFKVTLSFERLAAVVVRAHKRTLFHVHSSMQSQIVRFTKSFLAARVSAFEWLLTRVQVFVSHESIPAGKLLTTSGEPALVDFTGLGNSSGAQFRSLPRTLLFFLHNRKTSSDHD